MKVKYFSDTDTLYIEFAATAISDSQELDENTVLDLDSEGNICAMTFEYALSRTDIRHVEVERIAA